MQIRWHNGRRRDTKQTKASRVVGKRQARDDVREIKIYKFFLEKCFFCNLLRYDKN